MAIGCLLGRVALAGVWQNQKHQRKQRAPNPLRGYVRHADLFKEHAGAADREVIFDAENGVIGAGPAPAPAW